MDIKKKFLKLKSLRKKIKNKTSIGGWMQTTEPMIAALLGKRNFDWIVLDIEHGTFDTSKLQNVFRAIELNNKLPLVRLANHDKKNLGQLFDSGCCGVIIPNITSSKDLENIIKSCSWPPNGSRGVGFSRSNLFGLKFNQYKKIAQKPFIVAMIENLKALKFKSEFIFYMVLDNIKQGQAEGLYRNDLDNVLIAKFYIGHIEALMNEDSITTGMIDFVHFHTEMIKYHLRGICNQKGFELLNENNIK